MRTPWTSTFPLNRLGNATSQNSGAIKSAGKFTRSRRTIVSATLVQAVNCRMYRDDDVVRRRCHMRFARNRALARVSLQLAPCRTDFLSRGRNRVAEFATVFGFETAAIVVGPRREFGCFPCFLQTLPRFSLASANTRAGARAGISSRTAQL